MGAVEETDPIAWVTRSGFLLFYLVLTGFYSVDLNAVSRLECPSRKKGGV